MGDVSTGDGKDKRYNKKYSLILREYANNALSEPELRVYKEFFVEIQETHQLFGAADIILLDSVCFDFLRIKRLHKYIRDKGDFLESEFKRKDGSTYSKVRANEANYLLNAVETQMRQNMKELMLTRKEITKKAMSMGDKDLAGWLAKPIDAEVVGEEDE